MRALFALMLAPVLAGAAQAEEPACTPAHESVELSELGGQVPTRVYLDALEQMNEVTIDVFDGALPVMTAEVQGVGQYVVLAPPGEYWLRLAVAGHEVSSELVRFGPGSWPLDFRLPALPFEPVPVARR
jgi:hypothetical protein